MTKSRRLGKFMVTAVLIDDAPAIIKKIMSKCVIVRCEYFWGPDYFEYMAISDEFEEVKPGGIIPAYEPMIYSTPYGYKVYFQQVEG